MQYELPAGYLSASSLNCLLTCPRQYEFRYIERIPVAPSASMLLGTALHRTLETYYKGVIANPDNRLTPAQMQDLATATLGDVFTSEEHYSRRLYAVPLGEPHVFTRNIPARLVSTAVHILVDRSGSTGRIARESAISAYAVAHAAAGIRGVSVGMSAFPCGYDDTTNQPGVCTLLKHGQLSPRYLDFGADGSTPFSEAVYHVIPVLMKQRTYRRILLIFTDGRPDSVETAKAALHDAAALGIEVYGVSFKSDSIIGLLGADRSVVIDKIDQLPRALSNLLLSALRKAA